MLGIVDLYDAIMELLFMIWLANIINITADTVTDPRTS